MDETIEYRVYRRRWLQLLIYFLATFTNAIHNMTFAPIQSETSEFFHITTTQVNALAIVFQFFYVLGTILSIWIYRVSTLRMGMLIGSIFNLGVFIRLFALITPSQGYAALIIGQILPAIATPIFMNITALFAARWFAPKQRDLATSIGSMANPLGLAIGSLIPSLIVTKDYSSRSFFILLIVEAVFTAVISVLVIVICRSEPPTPTSSIEQQQQNLPLKLKENFLDLVKNRHYLILLFSFSIGLALFCAITSLLAQLVEPTGYSSDDAGIFGAIIIIVGLISAFLVGLIMDRTHAYRLILKILLTGACASAIYFVLILQPNKFYPLAVSIGLMGLFLLPMLPVSFECAVECTYPIRAEWSTALLLCIGNVLGGVFILILGHLITLSPLTTSGIIITPASIFILCCFIIAAIVLYGYRGPYLRLESERQACQASTNDTAMLSL